MTFRGHIQNGKVVLDTPVDLPDGTEVELRRARKTARRGPVSKPKAGPKKRTAAKTPARPKAGAKRSPKNAPTLAERYKGLVGLLNDLPADFSTRHDHYIHGAPKR